MRKNRVIFVVIINGLNDKFDRVVSKKVFCEYWITRN